MTAPANGFFIRTLRFSRLLLHFVRGLATAGLLFPIYTGRQRDRAIVSWARQLLHILHLRVEVRGNLPSERDGGYVVAANHVSWLDIFVIHTVRPARFVAKSEIRGWPIAGWLCARAGTLFIERGRRHHTAAINERMRETVLAGGIVGLFPEGTTSDGAKLKKFHSSLFEAVVASGAPLVPAALRYTDMAGHRSLATAYVGDMNMAQSIVQIIASPELRVELHFALPIKPGGKKRQELAREAHAAIACLLDEK